MHYRLFLPDVPAREVPAWELEQRRILAEDREGREGRLLTQRIQAMQVSPRRIKTA